MGRDTLAQDYVLKVLTATLMYPESETGEQFWDSVYEKLDEQNTVDVDTFNKVWIVPDIARVYENNGTAVLLESRLKVMHQNDLLAREKGSDPERGGVEPRRHEGHEVGEDLGLGEDGKGRSFRQDLQDIQDLELGKERGGGSDPKRGSNRTTSETTSEIFKDLIIPAIEDEVNHGESFAKLRQIYSASILAAWYKKRLHESLLNRAYSGSKTVNGIDIDDPESKQRIYDDYVSSFEEGIFNYIAEEYDPEADSYSERHYVAGGVHPSYHWRRNPRHHS